MGVPFFTKDKSFNIYQKLNAIFYLKKIWVLDLALIILIGALLSLNFLVKIIFLGKNDPTLIFHPIDSLFSSSESLSNWGNWYNIFYIFLILFLVGFRFFCAYKFLEKLELFSENNPKEELSFEKKFKILIFLPFLSFSLYKKVEKLSQFEILEKYNL